MQMKQTVQESANPALQDPAIFDGNGLIKKDSRSLEKSRNSGENRSKNPEFRDKTSQGLINNFPQLSVFLNQQTSRTERNELQIQKNR